MAGDQQRHQLVAQLLLGHRRAVLVARREQHRQHVVALLGVGLGAALVDQLEEQRVGLVAQRARSAPTGRACRAALEERQHRRRAGCRARGSRSSRSRSASSRGARVEPEDRAQDHLERERLEARVQRDRLVAAASDATSRSATSSSGRRAPPSARRGRRAASACAARGARPRRAGSPSCAPTTGSRMRAPSPGCRTSGGAVKTSLISSGSDSITNGGVCSRRSVKRLP